MRGSAHDKNSSIIMFTCFNVVDVGSVLKSLLLLDEAAQKGKNFSPTSMYNQLKSIKVFLCWFLLVLLSKCCLDILPNWIPNTENDVHEFLLSVLNCIMTELERLVIIIYIHVLSKCVGYVLF